jgi:ubiquinone biosynthesis accessory factor UbiJ
MMLSALEAAFNRYLQLDPATLARLAPLSGKVIAIELLPVGLELYLLPGAAGVRIQGVCELAPDATLRGTPFALLRLQGARADSQVLFSGDVEISGDTELGQRFKGILDSVEIDWEEQLALVFGDVLAHQIGRGLRGAVAWSNNAAGTLARDLTEYLQEEVRLCPRRDETEEFLAQVDTVRMDVDRLEQRIARLRTHLPATILPPG